ncbi:MAG: PTS glucose transporter subunit IIA [Lachnospiraceae bacterium]|nr:PTS glucose transporter subunit IIA [Lachnospiraceae bacterium]
MLKWINDLMGNKNTDKGGDGRGLKLYAFLEGETVSLKDVPDQVFSKKILGTGMATMPSGNLLLSPIDGKVAAIMKRTGHSCCVRGEKGLEILLHIGVNTVEMNGDGFEILVTDGQEVKAGDPLLKFSPEKIKEAGLPLISSMVITEMGEYRKVSFKTGEIVKKGDVIGELN